ncbi:cytochrome c [Puniceicoccaceae bacterium K14]|nr:cytochrome c [Puniceicoccaceae bacterium K14]
MKLSYAICALLGGAMVACISSTATEESERDLYLKEKATDSVVVEKGKESYQAFCLACHGEESVTVESVSNLFDDKWYRGGTPEKIESSILKGYLDTGMPPWEGMLPEEDIVSIVAYLLSFES